MSDTRTVFALLGLCSALMILNPAKQASAVSAVDCDVLRRQYEAAHGSRNLAAMKATSDMLTTTPGCDDQFREWARLTIAREQTRGVQEALAAGQPLLAQAAALQEALGYGRVWQAAAWLGDIAYDAKLFADATHRYQEALSYIADEQATPNAPTERVIAHLFRRGELSRLAADSYIPPPRNRAGAPTGLGSSNIRGFVPKKVAIPIEFEFGTDHLTARGGLAVQDLLASLTAASPSPPAITLVGHTDPVGSEADNQILSLQRASAVRDMLLAAGFSGAVTVDGRGESEPLQIEGNTHFSLQQYHQMLRRVEVVK